MSFGPRVTAEQWVTPECVFSPSATFLPPVRHQGTSSVREALNGLLDQLEAGGWDGNNESQVEESLRLAGGFVAELIANCKSDFDAGPERSTMLKPVLDTFSKGLTEYKKGYDGVMDIIRNRPEFPAFIQDTEAHRKELDLRLPKRGLEQTRTNLVMLYKDAVKCKPAYDAFMQRMSAATKGKFVQCNTLKRLFRACEKAAMRTDEQSRGRAEKIYDVVRGAQEYNDVGNLNAGVNYLREHTDEFVPLKLKNRFDVAADGGWCDLVYSGYMANDVDRHVCEIQLHHSALVQIRTSLGGHDG